MSRPLPYHSAGHAPPRSPAAPRAQARRSRHRPERRYPSRRGGGARSLLGSVARAAPAGRRVPRSVRRSRVAGDDSPSFRGARSPRSSSANKCGRSTRAHWWPSLMSAWAQSRDGCSPRVPGNATSPRPAWPLCPSSGADAATFPRRRPYGSFGASARIPSSSSTLGAARGPRALRRRIGAILSSLNGRWREAQTGRQLRLRHPTRDSSSRCRSREAPTRAGMPPLLGRSKPTATRCGAASGAMSVTDRTRFGSNRYPRGLRRRYEDSSMPVSVERRSDCARRWPTGARTRRPSSAGAPRHRMNMSPRSAPTGRPRGE